MAGLPAQSSKPIALKGLMNSLKTHGLGNAEFTKIVRTRGVDFELTPDMESDLKVAGADTDSWLPSEQIFVAFLPRNAPPPETPAPAAPGNPSNIARSSPANDTATKHNFGAPPAENSKPAFVVPPNVPIHQDGNLSPDAGTLAHGPASGRRGRGDEGNATKRQGNVTITDLRGTAELWDGEAGDKGLYLVKVQGGEKNVAERLVSSLRKALQ